MVLADRAIRRALASRRIRIEPMDESGIQPASIEVHLSNLLRTFEVNPEVAIDPQDPLPELTRLHPMKGTPGSYRLAPGEFLLGSTVEWIKMPDDLVARIEGKSSLGRLGLAIHATAGFIDPGFEGDLTLEISNLASMPIILRENMRIGQIAFMEMSEPVDRPYGHPDLGSHYQLQKGPTASRH